MVKDDSALAAGESGTVLCIINAVCCKILLQSCHISAQNCSSVLLHHLVTIILPPRDIRFVHKSLHFPSFSFFSVKRSKQFPRNLHSAFRVLLKHNIGDSQFCELET